MSNLPTLAKKTFELTVPSTGKKIVYRAFVEKERSLILMVNQGGDNGDIYEVTKEIINSCVVSRPFDINALTTYDMEYILLMLRAKSQSNIVENVYRCLSEDEATGHICGNEMKVFINIDDIKIDPELPESKIILDEKNMLGVVMKPPTVGKIINTNLLRDKDTVHGSYKVIISCIDSIFDKDSVYDLNKVTTEELEEFLMNLEIEQFNKISEWVGKLPHLHHEITFVCSKCKFTHNIKYNGLNDFFV